MNLLKNITSVKYRLLGFTIEDTFLSANASSKADINYFIQAPQNVSESLTVFYTLLIDLSQSQTAIWNNIYHRSQSEIASFLNNNIYEHKILFNLQNHELEDFITRFDLFAKHKKIRKAEKSRLKAYNLNGILAISYVKQNNQFLCINFYRVTGLRALNLHSFSLHKITSSPFGSSHFGKAHRALHWLDILEFKNFGVDFYDFGGWYEGKSDKELMGINRFKEQFSQHKVKEYSGAIYNNRLLRFIKKLKG